MTRSKELWWFIVGGLVKSRKLFQLFYHEERGTAVLSELFKIAVRKQTAKNNSDFAHFCYII